MAVIEILIMIQKLFSFETNIKVTGYLTFSEYTETINYLWNLSLNNISNYILLILDLIKIITEPL
jgi:hypothetical protein